MITSLQKHC